jgi:hypothetical protein
MSKLHITQIISKLKTLFEGKIDASDLKQTDKEYEIKLTSRYLSAYAVYYMSGCTTEEAGASVVDGGDDNGIDAIYVNNKKLLLVQSKFITDGNGSPDLNSISKFARGVKDLINEEYDRFNEKVKRKTQMIENALQDFETTVSAIIIDTGNKEIDLHGQRIIDDLMSELNDSGDTENGEIFRYERINQGKIYNSLAQSASDKPLDFDICLQNWGKYSEPLMSYYGVVSAMEVSDWHAKFGKRLFEKNIRQSLGATDVNKEILSTIHDSPDNFWYFNNGITLVASKIEKSIKGGPLKEAGYFNLTGAQVINGAQTVSCIGDAGRNGADLGKVKVFIRIISLANSTPLFGDLITKANNRQNRIENRDFVGQDVNQIRIKTELLIEGIEYHIVRSASFTPGPKSFDLIEATIALATSRDQIKYAVQAKREIGKYYEDLNSSLYQSLYNPTTNSIELYNRVCIIREIDKVLQEQISKLRSRSGPEYGIRIHGNRVIAYMVQQSKEVSKGIETINFNPDSLKIVELVNNSIEKIKTVIGEKYKGNVLGTLFKNADKCADLVK